MQKLENSGILQSIMQIISPTNIPKKMQSLTQNDSPVITKLSLNDKVIFFLICKKILRFNYIFFITYYFK